jgi:maltooligosyltrehalose trehalohydrolase
MPLAQFAGARGWGYDGVFPNAVQNSYGGPEGLARFVDAAHGLGIGVVVDAVYNHFGPEGNVLPRFGPYLTDTYATPWGAAVNLSEDGSDQVRRLFVDNARTWIADYHADGLRLDAVHAIVDPLALPFLEELHTAAHELGRADDRIVNTFLESAANDPRMLAAPPGGWGGDAQWNDEFHHGLRVGLTGDRSGYYADYEGACDLADVFRDNLTFSGRYSPVRGRRHGRDMSGFDPARFVVFDQNHDQIGNRRDGERLGMIVGLERRKLALAATLLSPFTPMLFMGEEYGDPAPFPFFVDFHSPDLLEAVRRGRAEEFAGFEWEDEPPDPGSIETFRSAILDPDLAAREPHSRVEALSVALLRIRRQHAVVTGPEAVQTVEESGGVVVVRRRLGPAAMVLALALTDDEPEVSLDGGSVVVDTASADFGGPGAAPLAAGSARLRPWSALLALR